MTLNLGDAWEGDFYDLTVGAEYLHARCCESLSGFHAAHYSPYPAPIGGDDLDVVLAVKGL